MSKVRIKIENNEIEVEGTDTFIQKQLKDYFDRLGKSNFDVAAPIIKKNGNKPAAAQSDKVPAPAEFYKGYGKTDGISQILIFGKYLEIYENKNEFSQKDINELVDQAKLPKDVHPQYFSNAVKSALLKPKGKGVYALTLTGEDYLDKIKG